MSNDIVEWVDWLQDVRQVRGATTDAYRRTLFEFANFVGHENWATVDGQQIEAFMGRERRGGITGAAATQDRDRVAVGGFYKYLIARGRVPTNPIVDVGVPKVRNRQPRAIPDLVWTRLWQASNLPDDDRLWLGLGCFAGLRRQEIVSVAPCQIDPQRGLILHLERKGGTEGSIEYVELAQIVSERFPHLLPTPDVWTSLVAKYASARASERCLITMDSPATDLTRLRSSFTDPNLPDPAVINRRLKTVLRTVGLPPNAFTPHALRHTCATNLIRAGLPIELVADILGHSDIDTTRRYIRSTGMLSEWRTRLAVN